MLSPSDIFSKKIILKWHSICSPHALYRDPWGSELTAVPNISDIRFGNENTHLKYIITARQILNTCFIFTLMLCSLLLKVTLPIKSSCSKFNRALPCYNFLLSLKGSSWCRLPNFFLNTRSFERSEVKIYTYQTGKQTPKMKQFILQKSTPQKMKICSRQFFKKVVPDNWKSTI